ncbi:MAG: hypothetical protein OHK0022_44660 [Roseiflexaceae bacterium]
MAGPKWSDFGNIWNTLRELDVSAIRDEAERVCTIACVGHSAALDELDRLLHSGAERYPASGPNPLEIIPLDQAAARASSIRSADLLIITIDGRTALNQAELEAFVRLDQLTSPFLLVVVHGDRPAAGSDLPRLLLAHTLALPDPAALDASDRLAAAVLERLPGELHLSAARKLPGLRATYARDLINNTSFTNATYALASGLPEQIPIISVPFAAADMLVLTKNQALLVYRLALAHGAQPDFAARIREVVPVVGGAFLWRQAARSLVGLIPIWGLVPKVAIAYAGTYTTGVTAWRWYATGEIVSTDQVKRITQESLTLGRRRAEEIIGRAREVQAEASKRAGGLRGFFQRLLDRLPGRRKKRELTPPNT